jgi:hypothetical protein
MGLIRNVIAALVVLLTLIPMPLMVYWRVNQWCNELHPVVGMFGIVNANLIPSRLNSGYVMATLNGDVIRVLEDGSQVDFYHSKISVIDFLRYWIKYGDQRFLLSYFYPFRAMLEEPDGVWYQLEDPDIEGRVEIWHENNGRRQLIQSFNATNIHPAYFTAQFMTTRSRTGNRELLSSRKSLEQP